MSRSIPFWPSEAQAGKPLHPAHFKRPKKCDRCGKQFLFWRKSEGEWRLHHYADISDGQGPRYILHRCGFTSNGEPISARNLKGQTS